MSRRRVILFNSLRDTSTAGATPDQPRDCDSRASGGCPLAHALLTLADPALPLSPSLRVGIIPALPRRDRVSLLVRTRGVEPRLSSIRRRQITVFLDPEGYCLMNPAR